MRGRESSGCESIEQLLPLVVNGRLSEQDEARVALHLASCETCQDELACVLRLAESFKHTVDAGCSPKQGQLNVVFASLHTLHSMDMPQATGAHSNADRLAERRAVLAEAVVDQLALQCPGLGWIRRAYRVYRCLSAGDFARDLRVGPITIAF